MELETNSNQLMAIEFLNLEKIIFFIIGIVLLVLLVRLMNNWSTYLQNKFTSKRLYILQITTIIGFIIYLFGFIFDFYVIFQPTKEVLVAAGGSAAVAIGFALKDLVGSIIAGFILLLDRPFQVGDRVAFGEYYGEIKAIGLRSVRLQTLDDNLVTIPNAKFLTDSVSSGNTGALDMMIVCNFYISLFEDFQKVREILHEVTITSRFVYLEKPVSIVFEEIAISNTFVVKIMVKAYVFDVKYEKAFQSDIVVRGNKELNKNNISRGAKNLSLEKNN
jgi:small-conductance mechanosensitive channel